MSNPRDRQALDILCRLTLIREEEAEKANIRYREASGGMELIPFLLDGGYLGRSQIARLHAMSKSRGGDLWDEERETLSWICEQLPPDLTGEDVKPTDVRRSVRSKTLVDVEPRLRPDDEGDS